MNIAFVLYPQILATGVSIPVEMFHAAALAAANRGQGNLQLSFVAEQKGPVTVTAGLQLVADHDFNDTLDVDWLFIPPMWGSPWSVLGQQTALQSWIVKQYQRGCRLIATGTGVGHLAMAGLITGRVATTHWYYLPRFSQRFPQVKFQKQHFITHQDGVYCAGSINAQTDLVLYFIEREYGAAALALVEQQFMHELKRTFSTPFYEPGGGIHDDEAVSVAQSWIRSHYAQPISIGQVAQAAGQSERQLRRRFEHAVGESPQRYLLRVRIEAAQSLLRETNLLMIDIALASGFNGSAYFSRIFKKHTAMSPSGYRTMVRNKRFSVGSAD